MTLFEKIYWTYFVISCIMFLIAYFIEEDSDGLIDLEWMEFLWPFQIFLTMCYWILKLILWIWGIHISLFPSIFN